MMTQEQALKEVRKNRLNDLTMQGIDFIEETSKVINLTEIMYITEPEDDDYRSLNVYAVLNREQTKDYGQCVGYYIVWLYDGNKTRGHKRASFGWVREFLFEINELGEAIKFLNLKSYAEYRTI